MRSPWPSAPAARLSARVRAPSSPMALVPRSRWVACAEAAAAGSSRAEPPGPSPCLQRSTRPSVRSVPSGKASSASTGWSAASRARSGPRPAGSAERHVRVLDRGAPYGCRLCHHHSTGSFAGARRPSRLETASRRKTGRIRTDVLQLDAWARRPLRYGLAADDHTVPAAENRSPVWAIDPRLLGFIYQLPSCTGLPGLGALPSGLTWAGSGSTHGVWSSPIHSPTGLTPASVAEGATSAADSS